MWTYIMQYISDDIGIQPTETLCSGRSDIWGKGTECHCRHAVLEPSGASSPRTTTRAFSDDDKNKDQSLKSSHFHV